MKKIKFPNGMSEDLAELVGIHLGDGSLSLDKQYDYTVSYAGNLQKDQVFMDHINNQYFSLFGTKLKVVLNSKRNSIELRIRSKLLYNFLKNSLNIPCGRKTDLSIPNYIKSDRKYLAAFLRGLFDTDGCVVLQKQNKYRYILLKISTKHNNFAKEIQESLTFLDIPSFVNKKDTSVNNKIFVGYDVVIRNKNVPKFFEVIGSKNPRNFTKYKDMGA